MMHHTKGFIFEFPFMLLFAGPSSEVLAFALGNSRRAQGTLYEVRKCVSSVGSAYFEAQLSDIFVLFPVMFTASALL